MKQSIFIVWHAGARNRAGGTIFIRSATCKGKRAAELGVQVKIKDTCNQISIHQNRKVYVFAGAQTSRHHVLLCPSNMRLDLHMAP